MPTNNSLPSVSHGSVIASELDNIYSQLAGAIDQASTRSELFLAMLSLKLMTQLPAQQARESISQTLADLNQHDPVLANEALPFDK